jgi:hypothetical protein
VRIPMMPKGVEHWDDGADGMHVIT